MFLQGRLYVRRHLKRVNAKQKTTVVKDLERIGRDIRGHDSSESIGEVDQESGRGASTLLWILGEGGHSRGQPAEAVVRLEGRIEALISDPEGFVRIEYSRAPKYTATRCKFLDLRRLWI